MSVDVSTANGFTKLLSYIIDPDIEHDEEMQAVWDELIVGKPIVNNIIIGIPGGKQYIVSVKPTAGWKV